MKAMLFILLGLVASLSAVAAWKGVLPAALRSSATQLATFVPILVVAIALAGLLEVLLPRAVVQSWLSDASGSRGIAVAWLAGILTPAGSLIGLPLVAGLYRAGAGVGVLVTYMTSFAVLSLIRMPLEVGIIGWRLTALRIVASLALPPLAGVAARLLAPIILRAAGGS